MASIQGISSFHAVKVCGCGWVVGMQGGGMWQGGTCVCACVSCIMCMCCMFQSKKINDQHHHHPLEPPSAYTPTHLHTYTTQKHTYACTHPQEQQQGLITLDSTGTSSDSTEDTRAAACTLVRSSAQLLPLPSAPQMSVEQVCMYKGCGFECTTANTGMSTCEAQ